ncbi:MAG TPA: DUF362 domain-containing protein [Bacillota bacterium]|nr:DUF362 domain-containing protein [Bacillota bacterium]
MANVYFIPIDTVNDTAAVRQAAVEILDRMVKDEHIPLEKFIPLKVHFGEKGNTTFIRPENYDGIIDYLQEQQIESAFIETNVLYRGERTTRTEHVKLAQDHGFTRLPVVIADGEYGEDFEWVEINQKYFKRCKIAKELAGQKQLIVLSHFKGHMLAGFGGAIKQLAMGFAARGGKLDQHCNAVPMIKRWSCKACGLCVKKCPEDAIVITKKARINRKKCIGCASCTAVCPYQAISNNFLASISGSFFGRLAEYAYAAAKDKSIMYITFVFNITRGCDCEGHAMRPFLPDVGVLGSTDPVALDQACLDQIEKKVNRRVLKKGRVTLEYAEKIGLGNRQYNLIQLKWVNDGGRTLSDSICTGSDRTETGGDCPAVNEPIPEYSKGNIYPFGCIRSGAFVSTIQ